MFKTYKKTNLEIWLEDLYKKHGILNISDLSIKTIAQKLSIEVMFMEDAKEVAIWDEEDAAIFLNPNKSVEDVRAIFFHELCHPFRHFGDQVDTAATFISLQEHQANQFMLYASMPFFMIEMLEMPEANYQWGRFLAYKFSVPIQFAEKRAEQIQQRIQQANLDSEFMKKQGSYKKSYDPSNWSSKTKTIMNQLHAQMKEVKY